MAAFLGGRSGFLEMSVLIAAVLDAQPAVPVVSLEQVMQLDADSRALAMRWLERYGR